MKELSGRTPDTLRVEDVDGNAGVQQQLATLRLSEWFDERGNLRFGSLGMTYAAKQVKQVKHSFGSRREGLQDGGTATRPAEASDLKGRAFCSAAEARERDQEQLKQRNELLLSAVDAPNQHRVRDVEQWQLEQLLQEVPNFERYLPMSVEKAWLLPLELDSEQEIEELRNLERINKRVSDEWWRVGNEMSWLLTRPECMHLLKAATAWTCATRGWCLLGMDRSTFCRFLLDLGLVDQDAVPLFWAVWLFDSVARPFRLASSQVQPTQSSQVSSMVSQWHLLCVMDVILRKHFNQFTKASFLKSLLPIARLRLPAEAVEESELGETWLAPTPPPRPPTRSAALDEPSLTLTADSNGLLTEDSRLLQAGTPSRQPSLGSLGRQAHGGSASRLQQSAGEAMSRMVTPGSSVGVVLDLRNIALGCRRSAPPLAPELPSDALDMARELSTREHLVRAMLTEPEVLNLVAQHQDVFRRLHAPYADGGGHMTFPMLLQFCSDFSITPALASSHHLQEVYTAAECCELVPVSQRVEFEQVPSPRTAARHARKHNEGARYRRDSAGSREEEADGRKQKRPAAARLSKLGVGPGAGGLPLQPGLRRSSPQTLEERKNEVDASSLSPPASPWLPVGAASKAIAKTLPWLQVIELAAAGAQSTQASATQRRPHAEARGDEGEMLASVFGPGALVELLCRVAFTYLGYFGSPSQNCMHAHARAIWLITYMRSTFVHMRTSLDRRLAAAKGGGQAPTSPLEKALMSVPAELWVVPPYPVAELLPRHAAMRPGVPNTGSPKSWRYLESTSKDTPRRASPFPPTARSATSYFSGNDASRSTQRPCSASSGAKPPGDMSPCVVEGICRLCGSDVGLNPWGSQRCRGCSAVEVLPFERHIFKPLLLDWPVDARRAPLQVANSRGVTL